MKSRKGLAWLLVLVMLLSLIPLEALAEKCVTPTGEYPSHDWTDWDTIKPATCTEDGARVRACKRCGKQETQTIKAAHKYGSWKTTKKATCTKTGTRVRTCTVCGHEQKGTIAKKPHEYGEWKVTKAATCSKTGTSTRTCSVCGAKETKTLKKNPNKHVWSDWTVTKEPTCTEEGVHRHTCTQCGKAEDKPIDPLGHDFDEWQITQPAIGNTPGMRERECVRCHEKEQGAFTVQGEIHLEGNLLQHARGHIYEDEDFTSHADLSLTNNGTKEIRDIVLHGAMTTLPGKTLHAYILVPKDESVVLKPGETLPFSTDLPIYAEDAFASMQETDADGWHKLFFSYWADYIYDTDNGETAYGESNLWSASIDVSEGSVLNHGGIWPVLTGSFEDRVYQSGEKVWIDLVLTNISDKDTVDGVTFECYERDADGMLSDPLVYELPDLLLMPGESYTLQHHFSYGIDDEAAQNGVVRLEFIAWCHSVEYELNVNCPWNCEIKTEPKDALSVGVSFDTGKYKYEKKGTIDWHPLYPEYIPGDTVSAEVIVSNSSDQEVTAAVSSDHPEDTLDGESLKTITLQPGEELALDLEIVPTGEEQKAGKIHRVISAAAAETALNGSGELDFVLYSGGWKLEDGIPALTLFVNNVVRGWDDEQALRYWIADMTLGNSGDFALTLDVNSMGAGGADCPLDILGGWGSDADPENFLPGEYFDFEYYIYPTDTDVANGKVQRTLNVLGFSEETEQVAADSASFTFALEDLHPLILSVTGEHRSGGEAQEITVDLSLFNQSNETVTVGVSAKDSNEQPPAHDSFTGLPDTLVLDPGGVFDFSYTIRPEAEERDQGEVIRTVTADGGSELLQSAVTLDYKLVPEASETDLLHLEAEIVGTPDLTLNSSFDVHLTATNLGNVDLENVTFKGVVQAADGQCLDTITLGADDWTLIPGDGLQAFPSFIITADRITAALAAHGVNSGTLTFTYTVHYTARFKDGSCAPGVSNTVTFTRKVPDGLDENGGIALATDGSDFPENPKADDQVLISLVVTNIGKEDLVGLKIDANRQGPYGYSFLQTVLHQPLDIIHPDETRPCTFLYKLLPEDIEAGMVAFEFVASSESGSRPYVYVARFEWSHLITASDTDEETEGYVEIQQYQANTPPLGQDAFLENDQIDYVVHLINWYPYPVTNIAVSAALTDYALDIPVGIVDLNGHEAKDLYYSHQVTSLDVEKQKVEATAYAEVIVNDPDTGELVDDSTIWTPILVTPVGAVDENLPIAVKVEKSVISTSQDVAGYALGEDVAYEIIVTNEYKDTAHITLWDWIEGEEAPVLVGDFYLIDGQEDKSQLVHTVTAQDVANGKITNQAYAAVLFYEEEPEKTVGYTVWADPVTVDTVDTWLPPPEKKDGNPEKKEEPREGKPICKRYLPEGEDQYVVTYCEEHLPVSEEAEKFIAAGRYAEAAALWEKSVNDLYDDLAQQRPDLAEDIAAERETFFRQIGSYRALATSLYGETTAEQSVSDMLRYRCIDLCYALHHPQEPLADIIPGIGLPTE